MRSRCNFYISSTIIFSGLYIIENEKHILKKGLCLHFCSGKLCLTSAHACLWTPCCQCSPAGPEAMLSASAWGEGSFEEVCASLVFPNDGQDFPVYSACLLLLQGFRVVIKFNCSIKQALQFLCVAGVPQSRLSKLVKLDYNCVKTKTHIFVCVCVGKTSNMFF